MTAPPGAKGADRGLELSVRGVILGMLITLVFTAANVFLGLKVGLTFASSIPAAVISMAALRAFGNATIYENNIVQTVASAAGTLSSIIFVLPGLVMIGWWTGFPFWESFGICALGGILGVLYTVPLRRALVTNSDLPYPEGVAAAEVLRVGAGSRDDATGEGKLGLIAVIVGAVTSAAFAAVVATRLFIDEVDVFFRTGPGATGIGFGLSLALLGAGHLVGLSVGLAMVAGLVLSWGIAVPWLTALHPAAAGVAAADFALDVWKHQVRFIGAGTIGMSALWTLGKLVRPVATGLRSAFAASRVAAAGGSADLPIVERDVPIRLVATLSALTLLPIAALTVAFLAGGALAGAIVPLTLAAIAYIAVIGFVVAAVCGYMAGLIGSSNSPVSGLGILTVLGAAGALVAIEHGASAAQRPALVAFALFVTAVVLCVATIANDNLQDLKTGQLVDATPWKQQLSLGFGVLAGAAVIPPVLDLLNCAYGFAGAAHASAHALPAPQATLISALARGVVEGQVRWDLIGIGALAGLAIIALDEGLGAAKLVRLPPLAVGIGIYLPAGTTAPVAVGALAGWAYDCWARKRADSGASQRMGVLVASGLIVGESLFGVANAGLIVSSGGANPTPLALVGDAFVPAATIIGAVAFVLVGLGLYFWTARQSGRIRQA